MSKTTITHTCGHQVEHQLVGKHADRDRGKDLPYWPDWCYMPLTGWYSVVSSHVKQYHVSLRDAGDISVLGALGAWRCTQGTYRFHPSLYQALLATGVKCNLTSEVFMRLPEWCVYVETPGMVFGGRSMDGFFAYMEADANTFDVELRLVAIFGGKAEGMAPIHLDDWTLAYGINEAAKVSKRNVPDLPIDDSYTRVHAEAEKLEPLVSLLLYICSDEPEISGDGPGERPAYPNAADTDAPGISPLVKPRTWTVGAGIGEKLRMAAEAAKDGGQSAARAQWEVSWTAPKHAKPGQAREVSCRWAHPAGLDI